MLNENSGVIGSSKSAALRQRGKLKRGDEGKLPSSRVVVETRLKVGQPSLVTVRKCAREEA